MDANILAMIGVSIASTLFRKPTVNARGEATSKAATMPILRLRKLARTIRVRLGIARHLHNVAKTVVKGGTFRWKEPCFRYELPNKQ